MSKGFTLFELLVLLAISSVLIAVSVPDLQRFYRHYQLRKLAIELTGFFTKARSEALKRRQPLWVQFENGGASGSSEWQLSLYGNTTGEEFVELNRIEGIHSHLVPSWESIKFDGRTGRVLVNGHLQFWYGNSDDVSLKLITHYVTGRVRICALGQVFYEYPQC